MWNLNNHNSTETNLAFCWICAALFLDTKLVIFSCNRSLACYSVEKRDNEQTNHLIGEILMTIIDIHRQYVNVEAQAKQDLCLPKGPLFYRVHLLFYWIPRKTMCTNLYLKKKENGEVEQENEFDTPTSKIHTSYVYLFPSISNKSRHIAS